MTVGIPVLAGRRKWERLAEHPPPGLPEGVAARSARWGRAAWAPGCCGTSRAA